MFRYVLPPLQRIALIVYSILLVPFVVWTALFIHYVPAPLNPFWRWMFSIVFILLALACTIFHEYFAVVRLKGYRIHLAIFIPLVGFILAYCVFTAITPTNTAKWDIPCSRNPTALIQDTQIIFQNVRNFKYQSEHDYDAIWETRTLKFDEIEGMDWVVSHWSSDMIGHTMVVFRFRNPADNIVLSVETRTIQNEPQDLLAGIFKRVHILWILGTEPDVLYLRTHFRTPREDLYLYPMVASKQEAKRCLISLAHRINELAESPEFYNTLFQNCTTSLSIFKDEPSDSKKSDIRVLLNGYSDQIAFEKQRFSDIRPDDSYMMYRARHLSNLKFQQHPTTRENYSKILHSPFRWAPDDAAISDF